MNDVNPILLVITLNASRLTLQSKGRDWKNGVNMIRMCTVYKIHISDSKIKQVESERKKKDILCKQ